MHWRKDLTIQTQFFEDDLEGIPDAILIQSSQGPIRVETEPSGDDYNSSSRTAAEIIQRLLSNKIIQNFISCWQTLKQATLPPLVFRSHHRTSHSSLLSQNRRQDRPGMYQTSERTFEQVDENYSSNIQWLEQQRSGQYYRDRAKIAQTHIQRANLLKQIINKLKKGKMEATQVQERIGRINGNYKMVSQIKHLEQITQQLQLERLVNAIPTNGYGGRQVREERYQREERKMRVHEREEDEVQKKLWMEMLMLRDQLQGLRIQNQQITAGQNNKQSEILSLIREKQQIMNKYNQLKAEHAKLQFQNSQALPSAQNKNFYSQVPSYVPSIPTPSTQTNQTIDLQFRQNYEKEMSLLHQKIKNLQKRQELLRQQMMKQLKIRQQHIRRNQQKQERYRQQILQAQKRREAALREQAERERQLKEALERQQRMKEQFLMEHGQKQQRLREQIAREQSLREQAMREHNQREIQLRERNLREFNDREMALKQQMLNEYKNRQNAIRQQENRLRTLQIEQQRSRHSKRQDTVMNSVVLGGQPPLIQSHYHQQGSPSVRFGSSQQKKQHMLDVTKHSANYGYGYSTTKTVTHHPQPQGYWHNGSWYQTITKTSGYQGHHFTSHLQEKQLRTNPPDPSKHSEQPKGQAKDQYCGCCY